MARSRFFREDFDRERNFITAKAFVFGGRAYAPGHLVDKSQFTVRRLRQLYDQRFIAFGPDDVVVPVVVPDPGPVVVPRRKQSPPTVKRQPVARRRRQVNDGLPA